MITICEFDWIVHGDIYDKWFLSRNAIRPIDEIVSPTGIVASFNARPVCMGWLCKTDSRVAVLTNLISDPESDKKVRSDCLDELIKNLSKIAEDEGFLIFGAASPVPAVCARLEKLGLIKTHDNVTNYGRLYALDSNSNGGRISSDGCSKS